MKTAYLPENKLGIDYVVGDIHGKYTELYNQLTELGFNSKIDRLICVGDLIDRGTENFRCLEILTNDWFFSVFGNHEEMAISVAGVNEGDQLLKAMHVYKDMNGNGWFLDRPKHVQAVYAAAFETLPYLIEIEGPNNTKIGVAHAEIWTNSWKEIVESYHERDKRHVIWGREIPKLHRDRGIKTYKPVEGIDLVIHGHSTTPNPYRLGNRLYINTGAYGSFTIMSLQECLEFKEDDEPGSTENKSISDF